MANRKIVIPIWSLGKSGGMRVLCMLANIFKKMGNSVVLVTYYKSDLPYYPVECDIQYVGKNGEIKKREEKNTCKNVFDVLKERRIKIQALKKALNRLSDEFDIVIANYHLTAYSVNKCKIRYKFYYIQAYEAWFSGRLSSLYNYIAKKSYGFNLIKIVNADLYKDYEEIRTNYVVPPGLDLELYHRKSEDKYWDGKQPLIIGHIGRNEEWKGSKDAAEAVRILQDEGANIVYKVAFNPPAKESCKFELVRPDGDNNLAEYYRSVDVLLAPGQIQLGAIHYPVIEAMACGTPVITTGYYPANNTNSYIVGIKSPKEIAAAIKSILSDYSLAMDKVEKATQEIEAFSWENVSKKMLRIIEENIK